MSCMEHIGGKDVFIFSLQYTKLPGRGESTNHNLYMIGNMDYETLTFVPESGYHYLDYGFDFYAAQTAANVKGREKAILIGWMGLPDNHYPTEEEDWEGSLSLPRELRVEDGHLIQTPVEGIEKLRRQKLEADGMLPKAGAKMMNFSIDKIKKAGYSSTVVVLVANSEDYGKFEVEKTGKVSKMDKIINVE